MIQFTADGAFTWHVEKIHNGFHILKNSWLPEQYMPMWWDYEKQTLVGFPVQA